MVSRGRAVLGRYPLALTGAWPRLGMAPISGVGAHPVPLPPQSRAIMTTPSDPIREIANALRRHVDAATLEKVVNELLDVPGNRSFRDEIEILARELMRR